MATGNIRLPNDAAVTGPRLATTTITEDSVTKHLFRVQPVLGWIRSGAYRTNTGAGVALGVAAHAATAGYFWLLNPVGSGVLVDLTSIHCHAYKTAGNVRVSSPRVSVERMTFSGTSSATVIAPAKKRTSDAGATSKLVAASTGITPTAGDAVCAFFPMCELSSASQRANFMHLTEIRWRDDEGPILAAGEGIVIRQADAGDATETTRVMTFDVEYREYTDL